MSSAEQMRCSHCNYTQSDEWYCTQEYGTFCSRCYSRYLAGLEDEPLNQNLHLHQCSHPRCSAPVTNPKTKSAKCPKAGPRVPRNARPSAKRVGKKADYLHNNRTVILHKGNYYELGDVVKSLGTDNTEYFAQIRGLSEGLKSAAVHWLSPCAADAFSEEFNPESFVLGLSDETVYSLDCFTFVCHVPIDYYTHKARAAPCSCRNASRPTDASIQKPILRSAIKKTSEHLVLHEANPTPEAEPASPDAHKHPPKSEEDPNTMFKYSDIMCQVRHTAQAYNIKYPELDCEHHRVPDIPLFSSQPEEPKASAQPKAKPVKNQQGRKSAQQQQTNKKSSQQHGKKHNSSGHICPECCGIEELTRLLTVANRVPGHTCGLNNEGGAEGMERVPRHIMTQLNTLQMAAQRLRINIDQAKKVVAS